jgi:hypothetical protein
MPAPHAATRQFLFQMLVEVLKWTYKISINIVSFYYVDKNNINSNCRFHFGISNRDSNTSFSMSVLGDSSQSLDTTWKIYWQMSRKRKYPWRYVNYFINYNCLGFKLSNPMHGTFIIENIRKITKYENNSDFRFCSHFKQWYLIFLICKVEGE